MESSALKLVSLNVERSKHVDCVLEFLAAVRPDVFCAQELAQSDIARFVDRMGDGYVYAPSLRHAELRGAVVGVGIFSRLPVTLNRADYYVGTAENLPYHEGTSPERGGMMNCAIALLDVAVGKERYRIGTTHFTWSDKGVADDRQRKNVDKLLEATRHVEPLVLTGDFNAPRGGEIWTQIAARYKDNIPPHHTTSIDYDFHRAPRDVFDANVRAAGLSGFMVDGLFTTPRFRAHNVKLVSGVSDHMAVVADISLRENGR